MADQHAPGRIYGSVFNNNLARNVWELRRDQDDAGRPGADGVTSAVVGFYHRKVNNGRKHPPFALEFTFNGDRGAVAVSKGDLRAGGQAVIAKMTAAQQILVTLRGGAKTTPEIAEALGLKPDAVRARCHDLQRKGSILRLAPGDDDTRTPPETFRNEEEAIEIAKYNDAGNYRPLKTAPNLRHGWRMELGTPEELKRALDHFYPGRVAIFAAWRRGQLRTTSLRETLIDASGMSASYRCQYFGCAD